METVVAATVPVEQFVLEETLGQISDVEIEFVRFAIHNAACPVSFFRTSTTRPDELDDAFREDPSVERVRCLSLDEDRGLYSVDWAPLAASRIEGFVETAGAVLDVRGTADQWEFQILFPDRATASDAFQTWCDNGIDPTLSRIGGLPGRNTGKGGLSATQHSTIAQAFETDYYDVPRGTTLEELATGFGVSHQAVSERLRRGHSHLVEQLLSDAPSGVENEP